MRYIIGLGNPGPGYASTKHNIGFTVVKALAKEYKIKINEKLHFCLAGKGYIAGEEVVLALPQTFMNLSGNAVGEILGRDAEKASGLVVICDDINLALGRIRLRKQGSAGGHKGLESIIHILGRSDFARLRVGIATDVHKADISRYVLTPFRRKHSRHVTHAVALAKDAVACMIEKGIDEAMTRFNKRKVG